MFTGRASWDEAEPGKYRQGKRFVKAESYKPVELVHWSAAAPQATEAAIVSEVQQWVAARQGALDHFAEQPHSPGRDLGASCAHWGETQRVVRVRFRVTSARSRALTHPTAGKAGPGTSFSQHLSQTLVLREMSLYTTGSPWHKGVWDKPANIYVTKCRLLPSEAVGSRLWRDQLKANWVKSMKAGKANICSLDFCY